MNTINRPIDVCIVSYGGVGCSALMQVLNRFLKTNNPNDADGLKHKNSPKLPIYKGNIIRKVIYVYNNPMNAVISLYRRNFQQAQLRKLTGKKAPPNFTLKNYAKSGIDIFEMEQHFHNWAIGSNKFPILMVNGATMYKNTNLRKIMHFLGVNIPLLFFQQKPRKSNYKTIDPEIREGLEKIYSKFNQRLNEYPDVKLIRRINK